MFISIHCRWHSHIGPFSIVSSTFEHFQIELCGIGFSIQPQKCIVWSFFGLPLDFNTPSEGIRILGVLLGTLTFTSSFIKNALLKDVWHVDLLLRMGDVQVVVGILIHCFMQHPLYFLWRTPPFSTFTGSFILKNSFLLQMFGHLLGPRFFDNPKGPLVRRRASFPITFGGIEFTLTSTITPTTYLRSWALVTLIIVARFMVDQHPFLFEVLAWVDNNTFPF